MNNNNNKKQFRHIASHAKNTQKHIPISMEIQRELRSDFSSQANRPDTCDSPAEYVNVWFIQTVRVIVHKNVCRLLTLFGCKQHIRFSAILQFYHDDIHIFKVCVHTSMECVCVCVIWIRTNNKTDVIYLLYDLNFWKQQSQMTISRAHFCLSVKILDYKAKSHCHNGIGWYLQKLLRSLLKYTWVLTSFWPINSKGPLFLNNLFCCCCFWVNWITF